MHKCDSVAKMTLPSSGTLSLSSIQGEFGGSNPISLSEYYRNRPLVPSYPANTGIPTSGTISINQFYGATNTAPANTTFAGTAGQYTTGGKAPATETGIRVYAPAFGSFSDSSVILSGPNYTIRTIYTSSNFVLTLSFFGVQGNVGTVANRTVSGTGSFATATFTGPVWDSPNNVTRSSSGTNLNMSNGSFYTFTP